MLRLARLHDPDLDHHGRARRAATDQPACPAPGWSRLRGVSIHGVAHPARRDTVSAPVGSQTATDLLPQCSGPMAVGRLQMGGVVDRAGCAVAGDNPGLQAGQTSLRRPGGCSQPCPVAGQLDSRHRGGQPCHGIHLALAVRLPLAGCWAGSNSARELAHLRHRAVVRTDLLDQAERCRHRHRHRPVSDHQPLGGSPMEPAGPRSGVAGGGLRAPVGCGRCLFCELAGRCRSCGMRPSSTT